MGPWDHGWVPNSIGHVGVPDKLQYHCSRTPWVPKLGPWDHCWVPKYVIWAALGLHFGTLGTYLCAAGHPMGHSGVHIEIYMDLGWILGVHWDLLWCHLSDILRSCDTKVTVWVAGWVFCCCGWHRGPRKVKKTIVFTVWDTHCPLWKKSRVLYRFGTHFGGHLGALGHILVVWGGSGNRLEFR